MKYIFEYVKQKNSDTKLINLSDGGIDYYDGTSDYSDATKQAAKDITEADVWLIGTPIYNSFFSAALKNLFEYIDYKKTAGLVILASSNSGFTDVQTLLTQLMSYFNVITNPRAVFVTANTIVNDQIIDPEVKLRLQALADQTLELASKIH